MHQMHMFLKKQVDISDEDWRAFSAGFEKKVYPAKSFYLKAGETENYLTFVDRGMLRFYVEDQEGHETTCGFAFEGWFMSVFSSFITRQPSRFSGQVLTETHLWRMHYDDLQKAYEEIRIVDRIGRLAAEALLLIKSDREFSLLTRSAEERYLELFNKAPHLIKHIPLKYLASYIGITPQALSRIRKRIS
ncbi:Crp/Fnr family transcriptional regulator [Chitinophaga solisilvae]|uniref:Crp/Fnr family transcriptional regulator n=1 Tax=Chitinophaga solisilvae TaxID=1233460 RepID=A0A3S1CYN3_9BACT|nr:Crp/Fnr family transcriptional regulator [Chitinophaga solisilvae]NSL90560.1 Crp/Fnr family transcriptional regulator [Chitinophaga solisilvae]